MSASCSLGPVPQATYHARRYPTVIRVLAYTGIRWAEMTALRVDSIDFDTRCFDIHRTDEHDGGKYKDGTSKNHKRRTVPFPSSLVPELRELTKNKAPGDRVFQSDRRKRRKRIPV
ncbi:tyrosine-type recombinase/integrase [Corynebacterium macclintockiae]|uniref:tyrosine-type recombinase/integrase n=2 Tax=Corynebacterium macclintockiae TaxID=2913501 RepID=UPI003EBC9F2B